MNTSPSPDGLEIEPPQKLAEIRSIAAASFENAKSIKDVQECLRIMQESLHNALPKRTRDARDALASGSPADCAHDLLWALRSEKLLKLRQEPPKGQGGEVLFERLVAQEKNRKDGTWGNQLVIWSGLGDWPRACIDLGFRTIGTRCFDLYELKLDESAGKEHEAIVELASYVVGYRIGRYLAAKWRMLKRDAIGTFSTEERRWLSKSHVLSTPLADLEDAERIEWTLIAPGNYFKDNALARRRAWYEGMNAWLADASIGFHIPNCSERFSIKTLGDISGWKTRADFPAGECVRNARILDDAAP
jgi:hypothetical protein